ncbi:NUDIX hydrolase [Paenibacillus aestuarii]|uniref:NUDIX domain-containing protein n=1 Tax=Paenibacillus aestuarii TaxID=516965 RepID=A0ABW0KHN8_9BACL|nr:8-oxo-dGTP diphosphatase [Paenibacillus aestuarii]
MNPNIIKYNLCFIQRGDEILLLNREKSSWMGCWNGVGGKVELGEATRAAMKREIHEETQIERYSLHFKGLVTWTEDGADFGGMYLYLAELPSDYSYATPIRTDEGILDWKKLAWIHHPENMGVATNIPQCLTYSLQLEGCYDHHCVYERGQMREMISTPVPAAIEQNAEALAQYLRSRYL